MLLVPLDSPRWFDLHCRSGSAGNVGETLSALSQSFQRPVFGDLAAELCSEGTAWSAAFAAAPYVLELARRTTGQDRVECLLFLGLVRISEVEDQPAFACPSDLRASYRKSVADTVPLLLLELGQPQEPTTLRYLLSALAAAKDDPCVATILQYLESGCPHCGEDLLSECL
jgi:hypothetical protein